MKPIKYITAILVLIIVASCSSLRLEPSEAEVLSGRAQTSLPLTRSQGGQPEQDRSQITHFFQTNHYIMLMNHVTLNKEGVYVQSLTEQDMKELHITPEEQEFGNQYVVRLNELAKR